MSERSNRKIPVTERQFLWVQDDDKGEVILHVGPTMVSPTAADRVVVDDGKGGFREDSSGRPQRMIEVGDAQYAVLYNPLAKREEGTNGAFRSGRNESRELRNGTRDMIPGPCSFYLRPGQRCEVRDAHELASNQYLVVKAYGEIDQEAPYHDITVRSAAITTATAEDSEGSTSVLPEGDDVVLTRGQLIVIRGLDTQFYIPPTGVDIVPDLSDEQGLTLTASAARRILAKAPTPTPSDRGAVMHQALEDEPAAASNMDVLEEIEQESREQQRKSSRKRRNRLEPQVQQAARLRNIATPAPPPQTQLTAEERLPVSRNDIQTLLSSDVHRQALERELRKSRLVRQAVVLGEKEFCVILDADGKRQIKVGPARVFPGPYDSFMTEGSDNRIYYAYELLPQRALWLRFIAPISQEKLLRRLPRGVKLESEHYQPGDEMLLTGVNSFFFPFNEIEILHPLTGQPAVGNDHNDVFIEAIGIDQKSGIYVRDLATGEARLVRGKQSYLVDPRKEVHITRTIPPGQWNMWVAANEPHKKAHSPVTTPWAISVTVPHNTAVMAASATGQRVIEGPCVDLLEYEETLVSLTLSTGTPKADTNPLQTAFLRTVGNRVSDVLRVITSDFVEVDIRVSYRVNFHSDGKEDWFNHEDYIGVMCDHLRSLVRSRCRQMTLMELWPELPDQLRQIILGERGESGRPGRLFEENGMHVIEVEVLSSRILDKEIATLLETVQRESVALQISDRQASEKLRSEKLRHDLERQRLSMRREARELAHKTQSALAELEHQSQLAQIAFEREERQRTAAAEHQHAAADLEAELARKTRSTHATLEALAAKTRAEVESARLRHAEAQEHQKALHELEVALLAARSSATVAERQAVQPALVEALTAVGDKMLLSSVAENMNLVSLFKGQDVASLFADVVGGTSLGRTIETMLPTGSGDGDQQEIEPPTE